MLVTTEDTECIVESLTNRSTPCDMTLHTPFLIAHPLRLLEGGLLRLEGYL